MHIEKTALPTGGPVFSPLWTIFDIVRDINKTNVLTNHVFHLTGTIFELNAHQNVTSRKTAPPPHINKTDVLNKFHDDCAKIVTPRVNTATPTGDHVFQRTSVEE
ncbi:hypothetical protein DPMN_044592 [Dreissena polymorpha]|uniref:Uncharacterized protein n=1 Tax=Dreissena polymorpha TaxID=45954 RepID=A0A9D4D4Q1_DREPO|nr:hypothetical protein DPMN_044592 [Dreissena polymorpha]